MVDLAEDVAFRHVLDAGTPAQHPMPSVAEGGLRSDMISSNHVKHLGEVRDPAEAELIYGCPTCRERERFL